MGEINGKRIKLSWYSTLWIQVLAHYECLPALVNYYFRRLKGWLSNGKPNC